MFSCRALAVTVMPVVAEESAGAVVVGPGFPRAEECPEASCVESTCASDTCVESTCPEHTACEGSSCPSDTCDAATCLDASFCEGDTCLGGPTCAGSTCPGGDSCEQATCGGGPSCSGDSCLGSSCPGDSCHGSSEIAPCFGATEPCLDTQECANTSHCDHTFLIIEPPPDDPGEQNPDDIPERDGETDYEQVDDEQAGGAGERYAYATDDLTLRSLHAQLEDLLSAH